MKTRHGEVRCQQRGIPNLVIDWLHYYGEEIYDHHGGIIFVFTRDARRCLERAVGREPVRRMSEWLNTYIVISGDGMLITTGKRYKRIKH